MFFFQLLSFLIIVVEGGRRNGYNYSPPSTSYGSPSRNGHGHLTGNGHGLYDGGNGLSSHGGVGGGGGGSFGQRGGGFGGSGFGGGSFGGRYSGEYDGGSPETIIQKHIYVHVPPAEPKEISQQKPIAVAPPEKHYKIIFIKAPAPATPTAPSIPLQSEKEEKTLIYVLVKKPDDAPEINIPTPAPTQPSKPEVYFIRYKAEKESGGEDCANGGSGNGCDGDFSNGSGDGNGIGGGAHGSGGSHAGSGGGFSGSAHGGSQSSTKYGPPKQNGPY